MATGEYLSCENKKFGFDKEPSHKTLFKFKPTKQVPLTQSQVVVHDETAPMVFENDVVDILHFKSQITIEGVLVNHSKSGEYINKSKLEFVPLPSFNLTFSSSYIILLQFRHGNAIRIYHTGAGYLCGSKRGHSVYFKSYRSEAGDNVSSNTCWVMEAVGVNQTKPIYRLRLMGTNLYLRHVDESEPGLPPKSTRLGLGPKTEDATTAFALTCRVRWFQFDVRIQF